MIDESNFSKEALKKAIANIEVIDPIDQIRTCAKELWVKDGCPRDAEVLEYWQRAEALMMGGHISKKSD